MPEVVVDVVVVKVVDVDVDVVVEVVVVVVQGHCGQAKQNQFKHALAHPPADVLQTISRHMPEVFVLVDVVEVLVDVVVVHRKQPAQNQFSHAELQPPAVVLQTDIMQGAIVVVGASILLARPCVDSGTGASPVMCAAATAASR